MKKLIKSIIFILLYVLITTNAISQSTVSTWVPLKTSEININGKEKTLTSVYSRTYFQARFMSVKAIVLDVIFPPIGTMGYQKKLNKANKSGEIATIDTLRINNSEFEKKLGDFDVMSCFFNAFYYLMDSLKYFDLNLTFSETEHSKLVQQLSTYDNKKLDFQFMKTLKDSGYSYISAFKFQYGVGARIGKEQLGFTKTYRPFVRVVGLIRNANTNQVVWGNRIVVFSDKSFKGGDEAKNATSEELISAFKDISDKIAKILVDDMNGSSNTSKDQLVDANKKDDLF
jgi:hypothetical protein